MIEAIKELSNRKEFALVLLTVFGFPTFYSIISIVAFLQGYGGPTHYSNFSLINLSELEVLTGCSAGAILYIRFWRIYHFNINMGWLQTLIGIMILAGDLLLYYVAFFLLRAVYTSNAVISTGFVRSEISILVAARRGCHQ